MVKRKSFSAGGSYVILRRRPAWAQLIPDPDVQGKIQDARQADHLKGQDRLCQDVGRLLS